eukprot:CAMPEP_0203775024 /NCGR_PEP_ID=MMETSP0099_2-20121227/5776_1 /ASSEMBLY_ACC=CAM_ASM_000209 /TAXON_ID=96639 /ORGANISM=" , Strain NY0313808BC1" /LENGTH=37 /DNA_ID= /DNA_START= /DNA_END= /DNA_ORIENTATION=
MTNFAKWVSVFIFLLTKATAKMKSEHIVDGHHLRNNP